MPSVILMEQLRTIGKHRLDKYIGHLKPRHMPWLSVSIIPSYYGTIRGSYSENEGGVRY